MTETPKDAPPEGEDEFTEEPRGAGKLIIRFFLLPLMVVLAAVGIFLVFNYMTFERRGPRDYLQEVRGGAANRRWQAAFELSRSLGNLPPAERAALTAETLRVFETLSPKRPDDLLVRRYLVLVLGRLGEKEAVPALLKAVAAEDPDTRLYAVWALGKIGDPAGFETVLASSVSEDAGARKMAAYVLGSLGDPRAVARLRVLAEDRVADVRWNAAIALAAARRSFGPSGAAVHARSRSARATGADLERTGGGGDGQRDQGPRAAARYREPADPGEARPGGPEPAGAGCRAQGGRRHPAEIVETP